MKLRLFTYLSLILLLASCSTKKNTVVSRGYHNLTARYNGYYYSTESIKDGVFKIENNNKENYDKTLPVYVYPTPEKAKATFPDFDKAIKKSTTCIQRHAIKDSKDNTIPKSGKWIDNNWINIGISRFYKREFFSGIEAFEYVVSTYNHSKDKYDAMVWLIKSYNEVGSVSSAAPIISLLKNEKKLPARIKKELPALEADYYFRKGLLTEASSKLMEAANNRKLINGTPRKKRARYSFIIAQMLEEQKDYKRARRFYEYTIRLKPNYEMVFYSKIKLARLLDVKRMDSEKTKKGLLKMSREFKNADYYDVIFYTLGEIEEKEKNIDKAVVYYKKSVQTSTINPSQKALSYLKLGEINFEFTNYPMAQAYYDSTLITLPNDHPNYKSIVARQKTLDNLVSYLKTIKREDSLQRFAKMSDAEKAVMVEKIIKKMEEDEEKAREEKVRLLANAQSLGSNTNIVTNPNLPTGSQNTFYFYNQNTISFGIADFGKKWGNRKNEDNWRRSNKALTIEDPNANTAADPTKDPKDKTASKDPKKTKEFYLKNLPVTDSLLKVSNDKIIDAFYLLGTTYKEDLNNNKKSIAAFEELNSRYSKHKYLLNTYYQLFRIYEKEKNAEKAEFYKNKILNDYPNSEFAQLIKNPKYAEEKQSVLSDVEKDYANVYASYTAGNYSESYTQSDAAITKFGKNVYLPKFEFIKAMSLGKLKGIDSLEVALKQIVALYPKSDVAPLSKDILNSIKKQKDPDSAVDASKTKVMGKDTFQINFITEHFILALCPDDPKVANGFKSKLGAFTKKYYSNKAFNIDGTLFGSKMQLIILKTFDNANEAIKFRDNMKDDKDLFKDEVKKELFTLVVISAENMPMFYQKKNLNGYQLFYNDNYKSLDNSILSNPDKLK
ncbi:MAG: tetratricopeptide repeat protein [Bacteroidota bacterium]|nr:tetratricopeptide repeat protein [Bacteroidota bacterium]